MANLRALDASCNRISCSLIIGLIVSLAPTCTDYSIVMSPQLFHRGTAHLLCFVLLLIAVQESICGVITPASSLYDSSFSLKEPIFHVRPALDALDMHNKEWSSTTMTLRRKGRDYVFDNYTVTNADPIGSARSRWVARTSVEMAASNNRTLLERAIRDFTTPEAR